ncbi:MAG: YihY/virulence factor BrkB family protein [Vulcanimicrobiaceae bacterium]
MTPRIVGRLLRETYAKWSADEGWIYAAALAAFAALALAPLLVITLRVAEALGGERTVLHGLALVIDPIVGHGGVRALNGIVGNERSAHNRIPATVLAGVVALFAGSRLFYALQRALHAMWNTPLRRSPNLMTTLGAYLAAGFLSVCVIGGMTALIFGSAVFSAAVHGVAGGVPASVGARAGIAVLGALILTPVVAGLFRWLPGTELTWGDVWIGALTTSVGFALAQLAIGLYLASVNLPWTYGSAASLVVVLLWLYYSSYLFLLGAEFTQVYSREFGSLRDAPPQIHAVAPARPSGAVD